MSTAPTTPIQEPEPRRLRPPWVRGVAVILVTVILAGAVLVSWLAERDAVAASQQTISQLSKNNDALRAQLERLGQKPIAPPAAEVIKGVNGQNGQNGVNGTNGQNGRSVLSLACEADGTWLIAYDDGTTGSTVGPCVGATGPTGATGPAGANGANGANGSDGQPPTSWTFTWLSLTYTCNRTDPFDPSSPTYSCSPA